jgi:hypothetical protein
MRLPNASITSSRNSAPATPMAVAKGMPVKGREPRTGRRDLATWKSLSKKIPEGRQTRGGTMADQSPAAATKVRGRFCVKRCGPSNRRTRSASAVLQNFGRHPKKTFSTLSAQSGLSVGLTESNVTSGMYNLWVTL